MSDFHFYFVFLTSNLAYSRPHDEIAFGLPWEEISDNIEYYVDIDRYDFPFPSRPPADLSSEEVFALARFLVEVSTDNPEDPFIFLPVPSALDQEDDDNESRKFVGVDKGKGKEVASKGSDNNGAAGSGDAVKEEEGSDDEDMSRAALHSVIVISSDEDEEDERAGARNRASIRSAFLPLAFFPPRTMTHSVFHR